MEKGNGTKERNFAWEETRQESESPDMQVV